MAIFNCYVSSPEGMKSWTLLLRSVTSVRFSRAGTLTWNCQAIPCRNRSWHDSVASKTLLQRCLLVVFWHFTVGKIDANRTAVLSVQVELVISLVFTKIHVDMNRISIIFLWRQLQSGLRLHATFRCSYRGSCLRKPHILIDSYEWFQAWDWIQAPKLNIEREQCSKR